MSDTRDADVRRADDGPADGAASLPGPPPPPAHPPAPAGAHPAGTPGAGARRAGGAGTPTRWSLVLRTGVAWLLGALVFLLVFATSPAGERSPDAVPDPTTALLLADLLLGQVAVGLSLLRRRWPRAAALLTMLLTSLSAFAAPAALLCVLSLATRRRVLPLVVVGAANVLAGLTYEAVTWAWLSPGPPSPWWLNPLIGLLVIGICALYGWNVGAQRALVESWRVQAETSHREQAARVAQAQLAERARIAREMHDVLAHRLSVVAMHAGGLAFRDDLPRAEVAATAETIRANAHTALEELREVLGVLRAEDVDGRAADGAAARQVPQPGFQDLPALVAAAESAGEPVRLEASPDLWSRSVDLPTTTGRHAYRVVQEALTNARKHAAGRPTTVQLAGDPARGLTVVVRNELGGAAVSGTPGAGLGLTGAGLGLTGMAERVALAGGRMSAGPHSREFVVDVWLPWQRPGTTR